MDQFVTEIETWNEVASGIQPAWESRAWTISKFIRANDNVVDLGAGNQKLKRYLPVTCGYYPVDCVAQFPETHIADFNKDFTLPDASNPIFVCAGLLEYVVDWGKFFSTLRKHAPGATVIASYHLQDNSSRQEMLTCNNFTDVDEVLSELAKHTDQINVLWLEAETMIVSLALGAGGCVVNRKPLHAVKPKQKKPHVLRRLFKAS